MCNSARVDQKGRLKIPATLLSSLHEHGTEFYITSEDGNFVRIYPMRVWNQVEEKLKRRRSRNQNKGELLARAKYFGSAVTVDKQGRILIPIGLRRSAQMHGSVDILDYLPYLEVWNHVRFLKKLKSSSVSAEEEQALDNLVTSVKLPFGLQPQKQGQRRDVFRAAREFAVNRRLRRGSARNAIRAIRAATSPSGRANLN